MPMDESDTNGTTVPNPLNFPLDRDLWIDSAVTVPSAIPAVGLADLQMPLEQRH